MVDLIDNFNRTQTDPTIVRRVNYAGAQALEQRIVSDRNISDRIHDIRQRQRQEFLNNSRADGASLIREFTLSKAEEFANEFDQANGLSRSTENILQNDEDYYLDDANNNDNLNSINDNIQLANAQQAKLREERLRAVAQDSSEERDNFIAERLREEQTTNQQNRFAFNNEGRFTAPNTRLGQLFDRFA